MIWSQTSNPLASRSLLPLDSNKQVESSDIQGRRESLVQFTASNVLFTTTLRYQRTWSYPFLEGNFLCLFHLRLVSQPEFSQDKRSTVSLTGIRASENIRGAGREVYKAAGRGWQKQSQTTSARGSETGGETRAHWGVQGAVMSRDQHGSSWRHL